MSRGVCRCILRVSWRVIHSHNVDEHPGIVEECLTKGRVTPSSLLNTTEVIIVFFLDFLSFSEN